MSTKTKFLSYSDEELKELKAQASRNFWTSSEEEEAEFWARLEREAREELCARRGRRLLARR